MISEVPGPAGEVLSTTRPGFPPVENDPSNRTIGSPLDLVKALNDSHPELRDAITEAKVIEGESEQKLRSVLEDVVSGFLAGHGHDPR